MDHILMKTLELRLCVTDLPPSREKSIIITKLDEIRHWATDLKATNPKLSDSSGDEPLPGYIGVEHH